jgi:hypothetical protein
VGRGGTIAVAAVVTAGTAVYAALVLGLGSVLSDWTRRRQAGR